MLVPIELLLLSSASLDLNPDHERARHQSERINPAASHFSDLSFDSDCPKL